MATQIRVIRPPELLPALQLAFQAYPATEQRRRIAKTLVDSRRNPTLFDGLLGRFDGSRLDGVIWSIERPGKSSITGTPQSADVQPAETPAESDDDLVQAIHAWQIERGLVLDQILVEPEDISRWQAPMKRWGYGIEIDLSFLGRRAASSDEAIAEVDAGNQVTTDSIQFEPIAEAGLPELKGTIQESHLGTLDCPQIVGIQEMDDVLTGYRATGDTDLQHWRLIRHGDQLAGCILCGMRQAERVMEIVYLGIIPAARRRGLAAAALNWALQTASRQSCVEVIAAVDRANAPALHLYRGARFVAWDQRRAWVRNHRAPR